MTKTRALRNSQRILGASKRLATTTRDLRNSQRTLRVSKNGDNNEGLEELVEVH